MRGFVVPPRRVVASPPPSGGGGGGNWQLAAGHYETAKFTLEIIAPRAGLSTSNRYYKAYPGIPIRLPVVVFGGAWPFKYELTTAPSGMTITQTLPTDVETNGLQDYGIITWDNPVTSGSPHSVAVLVTDQEGSTSSVSWTITVSTSGFIFIDSVNGNASSANGGSGDGTIGNPFVSLNDWYAGSTGGTAIGTKSNTTYSGYFVYYRAGSYTTDGSFNEAADNGQRLPCISGNKPVVHIGYPGETATIDTDGAAIIFYSDSTGYWFSNLTWTGCGAGGDYKYVEWDAGPDESTIFENTFSTPSAAGASGSNAAFVMTRANGSSWTDRVSFVRNTVIGTNSHDYYLGYNTRYFVAEGNTLNGTTGTQGHGFYQKENNQFWTIRANRGLSGNSYRMYRFDGFTASGLTNDSAEICWNNYKASGEAIHIGDASGAIGTVSEYRNTFQITADTCSGPTGNWNIDRNVVVHDGSQTEGHGGTGMTITRTQNLAATSGLIDTSTGLLTGSDRTTYLGIRGHEAA